jgi:hypothetical protein
VKRVASAVGAGSIAVQVLHRLFDLDREALARADDEIRAP